MLTQSVIVYTFLYLLLFSLHKKNNPSFGLGKKLKSYATIDPLSIFSLGKGRETLIPQTLLKTLKYCKCVSDRPLQCTSLDLQCVCDAPQNCPTLQNFMYILCKFRTFPVTEGNEILHLHFSS